MADTPKQESDRKKLRAELAAAATTIGLRLRVYMSRVQSEIVLGELEAALQAGKQTLAVNILNNQLDTLKPAIAEVFTATGQSAAEHNLATIAASMGEGGGGAGAGGEVGGGEFFGRIGIVFDPTNPRAVEALRHETEFFIKEMTDQQTELIREILAQSYENGWGPRKTAESLRSSIGLTRYQLGLVENYEASLRSSSAHALDYQLRNQSRDARVADAISGGKPLREAEIQRLVEQYRNNFTRTRAETIARTEGTRVTNMARQESFLQLATGSRIGGNRLVRVWTATDDDRVRDWHWTMDGQEVGLTEPFEDGLGNELMFPGDPTAPAVTVINCRCSMTLRIASPSKK